MISRVKRMIRKNTLNKLNLKKESVTIILYN